MPSRKFTCIAAMTIFATLAISVPASAQHPRYNLIDFSTLGGPASCPFGFEEGERVLNNLGAVAAASTATPHASGDCFFSRAFRWEGGVVADLGTVPGPNSSGEILDFGKVDGLELTAPKTSPLLSAKHRFLRKQQAEYGVGARSEMSDKDGTAEDPSAAAAEDYANRVYPADDIPFSATLNAIAGFKQLKGKAIGKDPLGVWSLIGPSTANFPDILTFSGQAYTTSGRITALAMDPNCTISNCRLWVGAAGGGVWRTTNALSGSGPSWTFVSGSFGTNAIGTLAYDAANGVLYAGTGEPNASGDSEAGLGIWKSTDGGSTWTKLTDTVTSLTTAGNGTYTGDAFNGRSISSIVVDPTDANVLYVSSTRGVRGASSVTGGATTNPPTPRPPFGLWKSTDGGANFTFIWDGNATNRGVNHAELDPNDPSIVYAAAFNQGIWRKIGGAAFTQIKTPLAAIDPDRAEFATTALPGGFTRMYVGIGGPSDSPPNRARFFRTDDAAGAATFTDLTTTENIGYCGQGGGTPNAQCWYDNFVVTPAGHPDTVYLGGSYSYTTYGFSTNGRGVLLSTDAGASFTDMTWDATTNPTPAGSCCQPNPISPNGMHPDQHAFVVSPSNPGLFFEGSDGGLVRSSGRFTDISSQCTSPRGLTGADLTLCQQLLSRVPSHLFSLNKGLSTLQFQSLSVAADNVKHVQGGTQDNGTFETYGSSVVWPQEIYGDGGQSGFNAGNSYLRFNTFTGQANDVNFQNGDPSKWVVATGAILSSVEGANFYPPIIADPNPAMAGSIFQGSRHVWRTQDWAGSQAYLEANCPEFTTSAANTACGDFVPLGGGSVSACDTPPFIGCLNTPGDLGGLVYGADRRPTAASRVVSAIARTPSNTGTAWASTNGGRVFISDNVDNTTPSSVVWNRVDPDLAGTADPTRFPSSIYIDPTNAHHAWISYSGYTFNTPSQPGHVFKVTWSGVGTATWTNISYNLPDLPITSVVHDDVTGDLYAGSDFGVMRLPFGTTTWVVAGSGLPMVEVSGLTIVPSSRVLYAATHGRSAWKLTLP